MWPPRRSRDAAGREGPLPRRAPPEAGPYGEAGPSGRRPGVNPSPPQRPSPPASLPRFFPSRPLPTRRNSPPRRAHMDTFAFTWTWAWAWTWTWAWAWTWAWTWAWAWAWARWAPPVPALRACTSYICTRASQGAGGRLQCALRRGQPARLPARGHGRLQPRQVLRAAPRPHHGPRQQPGRRRRAAGSTLQRPPLWRAPCRMHAMHSPCRAGWRGRPSCPYAALWCPYAAARRPPRDHCTLSCPSPCPLQEISRAYGPDACKLLPINSRGAGAPPLPDLWTGARPPEFNPTADAPPPPNEQLGALLSDADMEQARTPTPTPTRPRPQPRPWP